jgi:hypothetical protein
MASLQKSYPGAVGGKMMQDFGSCLQSSRGEFRRRRWDLSINVPADAAAMAKMVGESRWLRTVAVRLRPGQIANYEAALKDLKAAAEKATPPQTTLVSQAVAGQENTVFYISALRSSLAGFDNQPMLQQILGDDGYQKFLKQTADSVAGTQTMIFHFLPEMSNPPDAIAAAAPDFWRPKAAAAPKAKANAGKMQEKPKKQQ